MLMFYDYHIFINQTYKNIKNPFKKAYTHAINPLINNLNKTYRHFNYKAEIKFL